MPSSEIEDTRSTLSPSAQFLLGLLAAAIVSAMVAAASLARIDGGLLMWAVVFVSVWIATFVLIRKRWYSFILGSMVGAFVIYLLVALAMHR